jgi:hypothetical protein
MPKSCNIIDRRLHATAKPMGTRPASRIKGSPADPVATNNEDMLMAVLRAIPEVRTGEDEVAATSRFYSEVVGLDVSMEVGSFILLTAPGSPNVQVMLNGDPADQDPLPPGFTVDLGSGEAVNAAYETSVRRGLTIVEEMDDKPWGIRRFSVLDPVGTRVTMLAHVAID